MTYLLTEAFEKAQSLPDDLQNEIAKQLIEDIENEVAWQKQLSQPQSSILEKLAEKALQSSSIEGQTKQMGFDEL